MQPSFENAPWIVRYLTGSWHWHHPRLFVAIELLVSVWVVTVGVLLLAQGFWEGVLCFVLALFLLWFVYVFQRVALRQGT